MPWPFFVLGFSARLFRGVTTTRMAVSGALRSALTLGIKTRTAAKRKIGRPPREEQRAGKQGDGAKDSLFGASDHVARDDIFMKLTSSRAGGNAARNLPHPSWALYVGQDFKWIYPLTAGGTRTDVYS